MSSIQTTAMSSVGEERKLFHDADEHSLPDSEIFEYDDSYSEHAPLVSLRGISSRVPWLSTLLTTSPPLPMLPPRVKSILLALLPSYISTLITRPHSLPRQSQGIAALDGLRGLACLAVFNEHFTSAYSRSFRFAYGQKEHYRTLMHWPYIRLFWAGRASVGVFFVISGYVLCYKPLKAVRSGSSREFHRSLSSSVFRRALRLYLAPFLATFLCAIAVSMGFFDAANALWAKGGSYRRVSELPPADLGSLSAQLFDALKACILLLDKGIPWDHMRIEAIVYDNHLWTIPVEFRCSMVIFLVLLGTSRLRTSGRLACHLLLITCAFFAQQIHDWLFLAGMTLAEIDMIRKERYADNTKKLDATSDPLPLHTGSTGRPHTGIWRAAKRLFSPNIIWLLLLTIGLFLVGGTGEKSDQVYGFRTLNALLPDYFYWKSNNINGLGAILTTWAVANCDLVKPIFANPVSHYMGKVSFALYIVHGCVLKSLGYAIIEWTYDVASGGGPNVVRQADGVHVNPGKLSNATFVKAWLLGYICMFPICMWLADLFWRGVDKRAVTFAKWVEDQLPADKTWS